MRIAVALVGLVFVACGGGAKMTPTTCGDGVVDPGEQCDFGSDNGVVAGCNADCTFSCSGNSCDDHDPCNGVETCGSVTHNGEAGQACVAGTPLDDGTSCGTDMICKNASCAMGVCGDGYVTGSEECDDANSTNGDGCNNDCTFSCVSTDQARDCRPTDVCAGQGTCNDTTHQCSPGQVLPDNTSCGTTGFCKMGVCTQPVCGNGVVERGEDCDGGVGCKADCHWQCVDAATDCAAAPACNMEQCTAQHTCQAVADSSQDGQACGTGGTCSSGTCQTSGAVCGDGVVQGSEQCDFGSGNGPGTGCETSCTFSCSSSTQCADANPCNGAETCSSVTVNGNTGQKCAAGTPEADGTSCGPAKICLAQACVASTCGDGYVDPTNNESCEPPNQNGCDAACQKCGDGIRGANEQCDDHNLTNLDGCDASCKFEQVERMTNFKIAFLHSTTCPKDALGEAIVGNDNFLLGPGSRTQITQAIDSGIADGSITVELVALGMTDLTGVTTQSVQIGILGGLPTPSTATYDGAADKDWWYTTDTATIDASRVALKQLAGTISARNLTTSPGEILVTVSFVGVAVTMDIFHATLASVLNASDTPTASTTGMAPGHLASEHLVPTLTSFASMAAGGTTSGCSSSISSTCRCFVVTGGAGKPATCPTGELCGITKARSLYNVLVPSALTGMACGNLYSTANTLLDVYISGCKGGGFSTLPQIAITQPDSAIDNSGNPTSDVYVFKPGVNHMVANGTCTKNGVADVLDDCLDHAGYSSLIQFAADRVIAK